MSSISVSTSFGQPALLPLQRGNGEFDTGQWSAKVVADGPQDRGADAVSFGQFRSVSQPAVKGMALLQQKKMGAVRSKEPPVARSKNPA